MYCVRCGSQMEPGANFCTACGARAFEEPSGGKGFLDEYSSDGSFDTQSCGRSGRPEGGGAARIAMLALILAVAAAAALGALSDTGSPGTGPERSYTVGDFTLYGGMASDDIAVSGSPSGTLSYTGAGSDVYWRFKALSATYLEKTPYGYYDERSYQTVSGPSLTFSEPGSYQVQLYVGGTERSSGRAVLDGTVSTAYSWTQAADGKRFSYSVAASYQFSDYYRYASDGDAVRKHSGRLADSRFAVADPAILDLEEKLSAEYLRVRGSSASQTGHGYADYLLSFVQCCIKYPDPVEKRGDHWYYDADSGVGDVFLNGTKEYWAYPMETLYLGYGDCEDVSFLACALFSAAGYKSAVITLTSHMMAAVCLDSAAPDQFLGAYASGHAVLKATGEKMYYCEATFSSAVPAGYYSRSVQEELSKITGMSVVDPYRGEAA